MESREHIEKIIRIATGKEKRYERVGECARCGACCENEECEHLSYDDKGLAVCGIYGNHPIRCKEFPVGPPVVYKTCKYRFKDRVNDEILEPSKAR